jgi:chaperone LolA
MRAGRHCCAGIVVLALATSQLATATVPATALDRFLDGLKTLRAEFSQRVTDARGATVQEGVGSLVVERPGRFRWEVRPSGAEGSQLLVAATSGSTIGISSRSPSSLQTPRSRQRLRCSCRAPVTSAWHLT